MRSKFHFNLIVSSPSLLLLLMMFGGTQVSAQQMVMSAPNVRMTERWFENIGSSFYIEQNLRRGGWFFNWGAPVIPPYGRYDGRDARFGFGWRKGNMRGGFNLWASQGIHRSMVMEAPYITVPHGSYGSIQHGSWRPFVTGWTPVVGNQPQWHSPLKQFIDSGGVQSLTVSSRGNTQEPKVERVPQTLKAPTEDAPLTLINGEEKSD